MLWPVPPALAGGISVQISNGTNGGATPTAGQDYTLTCSVTGELGSFTPTYQWRMNGGVIDGETEPTLSFSPLRLSDAGRYTCKATVATIPFSATQDIFIQGIKDVIIIYAPYLYAVFRMVNETPTVQPPTSVSVVSNKPNPVRPVGSLVTLTCTVIIPEASDVLVTVSTEWTGPNRFTTSNNAQPVMGSTTVYTSTVVFNSFGRDQSGVYTCRATVSSTSQFLAGSAPPHSTETRVTVGEYTVYDNKT